MKLITLIQATALLLLAVYGAYASTTQTPDLPCAVTHPADTECTL